jgi:hypothetical protein
VIAAVLFSGIAVVATSGGRSASSRNGSATFGVDGYISVPTVGVGNLHLGDRCIAGHGYTDIAKGARVVVADEHGTPLALGRLQRGELEGHLGGTTLTFRCSFSFVVAKVPDGHPMYQVTVGRRGAQQYGRAQFDGLIHFRLAGSTAGVVQLSVIVPRRTLFIVRRGARATDQPDR